MPGKSCPWDAVGCRSLDVSGLSVVLGCSVGGGCDLAAECGERVLDQLLHAARLTTPRRPDCVWSATWDRDWRVARRAVSCSGQAGCRRAADCGDQAQALLLASARDLAAATLARA
ncbi:MAG: hypothetical protein AB1918_03590 [Pseudomonadota bacterium]